MSDADRAVVMMLHDNAAIFSEVVQLRAENDKLVMKLNAEHLVRQNVERENAKLRELVRELWDGYADPPCEDCPFRDTPTCADCPICARETAVIDRMRELVVDA